MVITLSGAVLLVTNKSDLLPGPQAKLTQVAAALTSQDTDSTIEVDGYTDSQGTPDYNQDLSQGAPRPRATISSAGASLRIA